MPFDFSCPDWAERLKDGRPPMPDLDLDRASADRAVEVYNSLRLPDVPGQPMLAEAGADWFRRLVAAAFGSADPVTGERRVGEIFCLVPKKNSKTTNSAALGLVALLLNKTPNAQMLIVGPTKDVAATCFSQAKGMIDADEVDPETGTSYLADRFHVQEHRQTIEDRLTGAKLMIKAFDTRVITGKIPLLTIIDELHVLGKSAGAAQVIAQIRGGMITRPDALLLIITTQSDEPPAGVFKTELDYARRVRDGEIKGGNMLVCLYEFPVAIQVDKGQAWRDPDLWPMVLPNLGKSITVERLKRLYDQASEKGVAELALWASQHLNIQIGMALRADSWVAAELWPAAALPMSLEELLERSECVTIGIDGGGLDDLLGFGVIGREHGSKRWLAWSRAWAHPEVLKARPEIAPRLRDFEAAGDLVICPDDDPGRDLREVAELCLMICDRGLLPEKYGIGVDRLGLPLLVDALEEAGLGDDLLTAIPQGFQMMPSIKAVERKVKDGSMMHAGQDLLAWSVGNARVEMRGSAELITKAVAGKAKIDPLMAVFDAVALMARNPVASGASISPWDDPDFTMNAA